MSQIQVKDDNGVRIIQLNRPEKRNALTLEMYRQLTEYLIDGDQDNDIKVLMICGSQQCFTAGNDLHDFLHAPRLDASHPAVQLLFCLSELNKPLVAAVSGAAVGIGTTILLHCDLAYADPSAMFQLPFVDLALVPEAGASLLLPKRIGHVKAAELLMLADPFDAACAKQLQLINAVLPPEQLLNHTVTVAKRLAQKPSQAIQLTKRLMKPERAKLQQHIQQEIHLFAAQLETEEAKQKFSDFLTPTDNKISA